MKHNATILLFCRNLITLAIFYVLPVIQLVITYQMVSGVLN